MGQSKSKSLKMRAVGNTHSLPAASSSYGARGRRDMLKNIDWRLILGALGVIVLLTMIVWWL